MKPSGCEAEEGRTGATSLRGDPRLCRGGSSSSTFEGVHRGNSTSRAAKHTKGDPQMDRSESLSHTRWECKYHVVFIPKMCRKTLYGQLRCTDWLRRGKPDRGGAAAARSRTHDDCDPTQVCSVAGS